jgi:hypothetical protein
MLVGRENADVANINVTMDCMLYYPTTEALMVEKQKTDTVKRRERQETSLRPPFPVTTHVTVFSNYPLITFSIGLIIHQMLWLTKF